MNKMMKRGISPVIATVLLISIALTLAAIVFIWAQAFFVEKITKSGEPIENACEKVSMLVDIIAGDMGSVLKIQNTGSVALAGIDVKSVSAGSTQDIPISSKPILPGESKNFDLSGVTSGTSLMVVPKLLGEGSKQGSVTVACDSRFGKELTVQ